MEFSRCCTCAFWAPNIGGSRRGVTHHPATCLNTKLTCKFPPRKHSCRMDPRSIFLDGAFILPLYLLQVLGTWVGHTQRSLTTPLSPKNPQHTQSHSLCALGCPVVNVGSTPPRWQCHQLTLAGQRPHLSTIGQTMHCLPSS